MPFWKCFYHFVWTTQNRAPWITAEIEQVVIEAVKLKSVALDSPILAINCVSDHIHVAVNIPPRLAVAEWVRNAKDISAHEVNALFPNLATSFKWQGGYGVLTFGALNLPRVVDYIAHQKDHHAQNTLEPYLEQTEDG